MVAQRQSSGSPAPLASGRRAHGRLGLIAWLGLISVGGLGCRSSSPQPAEVVAAPTVVATAAVDEPNSSEAPVTATATATADGEPRACEPTAEVERERKELEKALAKHPHSPETLAAAADLYLNRLPGSHEHTSRALEYARRGQQALRRSAQAKRLRLRSPLLARLTLLEGQALVDLGRAQEALPRLEAAIHGSRSDGRADDTADEIATEARIERAQALFELCRFPEARQAWEALAVKLPKDAWVHHGLALTLEQSGNAADAARAAHEFARARELRPEDFPPLLEVPLPAFKTLVASEIAALPKQLQKDLTKVQLFVVDLPELDDLIADTSHPPLSPTILGLFRGDPLPDSPGSPGTKTRGSRGCPPGEDATAGAGAVNAEPEAEEERAILLYRLNHLRVVRSMDELKREIRTTLLHELGHLHGDDEDALRERGLE